MPPNTGYQLLKTIGIDTTTYNDDNLGRGLAAGAKYCYRLVAQYPTPSGGTSYVSKEVCDSILIDVPAITNVDVLTTSESNGEITVRWTPPYQIDQSIYPPTYTYDLFRAENNGSNNDFIQITSIQTDTFHIDTDLNTLDNQYTYFVRFYDRLDVLVDTSATASSVRLELVPLIKSIEVKWSAQVPWSLNDPNNPYHYIYRDQVDQSDLSALILIDSVNVTSSKFSYLDNGSFNNISLDDKIEYCYYTTTYGSYGNPLIKSPLINNSQISCAQPNDTIPPCAPPLLQLADNFNCLASLSNKSCDDQVFSNDLVWGVDVDENCQDDIRGYNVYFSSTGLEEDYEIIETVEETNFVHENLSSYKGCYRITSVDRSGNESDFTAEICNDNCPVYKLPNAFTPNDDGVNDLFTPLYSGRFDPISGFDLANCPRFVKRVEFIVTDRSGAQVFSYDSRENENNIYINWDGKTNAGFSLEPETYFYSAKLTYDVLATSKAVNTINGWVQILK